MSHIPTWIRAGIGSRGAALVVDYALIALLTQLAAALLFTPTGGFLRDSTAFYKQCVSAAARPARLDIPPGLGAVTESICTANVLGWPAARSYVLTHRPPGSAFQQSISYWIDSRGGAVAGVDLALLQWPLLALMRWGTERRGGRSPGRLLAGLTVRSAGDEAADADFKRRLGRRYGLFALAAAPILVVSLTMAAAFGLGWSVPNELAAALAAICGLVPIIAVVAAGNAILRRRDTFYDAAAGTSVVRPFDAQNDIAPQTGEPPPEAQESPVLPVREAFPWAAPLLGFTLSAVFLAELAAARSSGRLVNDGVNEFLILLWGGASYETVVQAGQWYRLISSSFLHWNTSHLLANLVGLLAVGFLLEPAIGAAWFVAIFLIGGLSGAIASISYNGVTVLSAGASAGLMALFAAGLTLHARLPEGGRRQWLQALCLVGLASTLTNVDWLPTMKVDFAAHVGGAVAGGVVGLACAFICWRKRRLIGGKLALSAALALSLATFVSVPIAGFGDVSLEPLLIPAAETPKTDPEWVARAAELARRFPRDPRTHTARAVAAGDNTGERDSALASVEATARVLRPTDTVFAAAAYRNALAVVGRARRAAYDFGTAKAMFTRALAVELPAEPELLMLRADAEQALGELREARADLELFLAQRPDHVAGRISLADVLSTLGDRAAAIEMTQVAMARDPENFAAWRQKGWLLFLEGRYAEAAADLEKARAINSRDQYAAIWLHLASMRAGKGSRIADGMTQVDRAEWPAPVIRYLAGEISAEMLRSAAASRDAIKDRAQRCEASFYIGAGPLHGDLSEAGTHLRAAREMCPKQFYEWTGAKVELDRRSFLDN